MGTLVDLARAQVMLFERPLAPGYGDAAGRRMLVAFLVVGIGLFLALRLAIDAAGLRGLPVAKLLFVLALTLAFGAAHRLLVGVPPAEIGLRRLGDWTRIERLYLASVVPLAVVLFSFLFRGHLLAQLDLHGLGGFVLFSVVTGLAWGVIQELLYRGWLQTELTRRFGPMAGLLAANTLYTFGPLHFDYWAGAQGVRWLGFAAIFAIGSLFGLLYRRSGNLWIPAVLHGLWPLNMT
jgi:uncharacterized protein